MNRSPHNPDNWLTTELRKKLVEIAIYLPVNGTTANWLKEMLDLVADLEKLISNMPVRAAMVHTLKTDKKWFQDIWDDKKNFELRVNDREYQAGDFLSLEEYTDEGKPTGRVLWKQVTYVMHPAAFLGLKENWVILAIRDGGQ